MNAFLGALPSDWEDRLLDFGLHLIAALLILLVGMWVARLLAHRMLPRVLDRAGVDGMLTAFLRNVVYVVGVVLVIATALTAINVPMTSLVAVLGAAGLAIGLALKDSLSNIAAGVMLVTLRPFRAGDVVTVAGQTGTVQQVRIFQTVLSGPDNQSFTIPNNLITAQPIVNLTAQPTRRVELVIGIGYGDDIATAKRVALEAMTSDPRVLDTPPPDVLVYALGDNSVNLGIRCFVAKADWFAVRCDLTERIKLGFDRAGVSIPFPQRDMHLYLHNGDAQPVVERIAQQRGPQAPLPGGE
ncbi:mechanosensitive ion channel family protein [Coralloluteibacterium thermophilus]|uniref:Small-conductance mechanosensitive channel n=1 Tax=Coralloluteibacterium thermophilum TaxID=2707049 RepID=A0ABV9NNM5_9GAMM